MTFNLKVAKSNDATRWDEIVNNSNQATIFHTWEWLSICNRHSDFDLIPLMCYNGTEPIAIWPLFYLKKAFLKMVFSPPPHLGLLYLGPAFLNDNSLKQDKKERYYLETQKVIEQYLQDEINANYVSLNLSPQNNDPRVFKWTGYDVEPDYDYIINLKSGTEVLWEGMKKNARFQIKKADEKGVAVEEGNRDDLEILHKLMAERYHEQNRTANISKDYLLEIYDTFPDQVKILTARYNNEILTGSIRLKFKDKELSWIGSPKVKNFTPSPNALITWEEIKNACENKADYYIQMGTAGNIRLHSFFSKFNPDLRIRFDVRKRTGSLKFAEYGYLKAVKPLKETAASWRGN